MRASQESLLQLLHGLQQTRTETLLAHREAQEAKAAEHAAAYRAAQAAAEARLKKLQQVGDGRGFLPVRSLNF